MEIQLKKNIPERMIASLTVRRTLKDNPFRLDYLASDAPALTDSTVRYLSISNDPDNSINLKNG